MKKTIFWVVLIAVILAVSVGILIWQQHASHDAVIAEIYVKGKCVRSIDLSEVKTPESFDVEGENLHHGRRVPRPRMHPYGVAFTGASDAHCLPSEQGGHSACRRRWESGSDRRGDRMKWTTKQLTTMALLTAIALAIHVAEAQIPPLVAIPGVKLGLANIVTIYAAFSIGGGAAAMILIARILLGSMFGGGAVSFLYSFAGGMLCLLVTLALRRVLSREQIWVAGVIGAIAHNIGQILVAVIVTGTPSIVSYLPILLISGVLTGLFTGFAAQAVVNRIHRNP